MGYRYIALDSYNSILKIDDKTNLRIVRWEDFFAQLVKFHVHDIFVLPYDDTTPVPQYKEYFASTVFIFISDGIVFSFDTGGFETVEDLKDAQRLGYGEIKLVYKVMSVKSPPPILIRSLRNFTVTG